MPDQLLTRTVALEAADVDADTRTITARLCRWNDPRQVADPDGRRYREQHAPGSIHLAERVHVTDAHGGQLIGRVTDLSDGEDGPVVRLRVAPTTAGSDVLALLDADVLDAVSMEFAPDHAGEVIDGDLVTRTATTLYGVAFAFRPAHAAPVLTRTDREEPSMPDVMPDTPVLRPPPENGVDADVVAFRGDLDALAAQVAVIADRPELAAAVGRHPAAAFASLGEYTIGRLERAAEVPALLLRTLVDQITDNNPGVIPPAWLQTVFGIIDRGRPTITAFGPRDAGSEGMDVNWPYFDGDLLTLVGEQVAEKTAITSVRVDLKRGTEALRTFAGGSDISYQLIRRSSPSYRDAYMRIMMAAYSAVTDAAAAVDVVAAATAGPVWPPTTGSAGDLRAALFEASAMVQSATGSPASFALAATDVFVAVGGLEGLWPSPYGTTNVAGTADAGSLTVNVSGLPVVHDPYLADGTLLVSNGEAAGWLEDGPFTVAAEDVERLGQNVAVWGMGAWATFLPAGVIAIPAVVGP